MNVFLSWSGTSSKEVARLLRDWLPLVVQAIRPFMSEEDIGKGERWQVCLGGELSTAPFGIICITAENVDAPAIHFEAGALSNAFSDAHVCPFVVGLRPSDLPWTLAQFQTTEAQPTDMLRLLKTINRALPTPLSDAVLEDTFGLRWPALAAQLAEVPTGDTAGAPPRDTDELLVETLETVRAIVRRLDRVENVVPELAGAAAEEQLVSLGGKIVGREQGTYVTEPVTVVGVSEIAVGRNSTPFVTVRVETQTGGQFDAMFLPRSWDACGPFSEGEMISLAGALVNTPKGGVLLAREASLITEHKQSRKLPGRGKKASPDKQAT